MKPAAAYIRVSTKAQETKQQKRDLIKAAKLRGFEITRWFKERVSGRSLKRPELTKLRAAARDRSISVLFVWALDRLSRAGILDSLWLLKELEDGSDVTVISLHDPIPEPGSPHRDIVLSLLFWVAEQESRRRSERVRAALSLLKEQGVQLGRKPRDVDLERVQKMRAEGRSWRSIAKGMKIPKATILRAVKRSEN